MLLFLYSRFCARVTGRFAMESAETAPDGKSRGDTRAKSPAPRVCQWAGDCSREPIRRKRFCKLHICMVPGCDLEAAVKTPYRKGVPLRRYCGMHAAQAGLGPRHGLLRELDPVCAHPRCTHRASNAVPFCGYHQCNVNGCGAMPTYMNKKQPGEGIRRKYCHAHRSMCNKYAGY